MAKEPTQKVATKKHLARVERERRQRRTLLTIAGVVFGVIILVLAYGLLDEFVLKQNRPVAKVNNESISLREFQSQVRFTRWQMIQEYQQTLNFMQFFGNDPTFSQQIQAQLQQMAMNLSPQNAQVLGADVLEAMINDEVIRQEAARRGITVTDEEVERSLQEAFGFFIDGTPTPAPSPTPFATSTLNPTQLALVTPTPDPAEETEEVDGTEPVEENGSEEGEELEAEETPVDEVSEETEPEVEGTPMPTSTPLPSPTPYTLEGFQGRLDETLGTLNEAGITEADLRRVIRTQVLRQKLFDEITADVEKTEEQVWARHILVPDAEIAATVLERLDAGEDWSLVAAEMSTDASNSDQGGNLGWFGRGMMVSEFENAAFNMEIGEISAPVQTRFGFHIIQVLGKEVRPLADDQIQSQRQAKFQTWLEEVKAEQDIQEFDNWMRDVPTTPAIPAQLSF
jgi:peptidyl-prolyl cis-trans isomerase D